MKSFFAFVFASILIVSSHSRGAEQAFPAKQLRVHPTRILARYAEAGGLRAQGAVLADEEMSVKHRFELVPGLVLLEDDPGVIRAAGVQESPVERRKALERKIAKLRATGLFEYVEPDYIVTASALPDDSAFADGTLWGLRNTGQSGGLDGADIDVVRSWDLTTGSSDVIVGVIDSGIRYTHADLASRMWRNPDEIEGNGLDDDGDGYVDNIFGINAINGSGDPWDDNDHGTHCAGTIGAAANNGHPHVGVCQDVRLMALKFLGADGSGSTSDAIRCINFAAANGARILNNSWGGGGFSQALSDAIAAAAAQGVLFVAAAGNDFADNDAVPSYPANYELPNVISVAALDRQDKLADFSNYGATTVHLGAPGVEIYSTTSGSDTEYKVFRGTSMATPHVAGVAALVVSRFPGISMPELRDRLLGSVVRVSALRGRTTTGGRLNAYQALDAVPDGIMEIGVAARDGELLAGQTAALIVRVTDLFAVTDATVTGTVQDLPAILFRNDGLPPDSTANDGVYTAFFPVPSAGDSVTVNVSVTAPGKQAAVDSAIFAIVHPPANDSFDGRIALSGAEATATGTNEGASSEPGEPQTGGGRSVWWSWTAPASGAVEISTAGSSFDTMLGVYTGSALASLSRIGIDDDSGGNLASRLSFDSTEGATYHIAVDGYDGAAGSIQLSVRAGVSSGAPANNNFADRALLSGSDITVDATNSGAGREAGEPLHAGNSGGRSVWWSWQSSIGGEVIITTDGSSFDTVLAVYTGSPVSALSAVASDDDSGEGTRSFVRFYASPGVSYSIAVDGYGGDFGSIHLSLLHTPASDIPGNDNFSAGTIMAAGNATVFGSNVNASRESGEPNHAGNTGGRSVWWSWTAPESGPVVIHTAGSGFDTLLAVYTGSNVSSLSPVASNDEDPAGGITSRVAFEAAAGVSYRIAVDGANEGFGAGAGLITLTLAMNSGPGGADNDAFFNRAALAGESIRVQASNLEASREAGEPYHAGNPGARSVWWTWTSPGTRVVTVDTEGSSFDTLLAVYTGNSVGGLTLIAANDDGPAGRSSRLTFRAVSGAAYHIAVDGYDGDAGTISLGLQSFEGEDAPANDAFLDRIPLAGDLVELNALNIGATREPGEPGHAGVPGGGSVWWTWTADASGLVNLETTGSDFDTVLAVYAGESLESLQVVAVNDDTGIGTTSRVAFQAASGQSYAIAVDGYDGAAGTIHLRLQFTEGEAPRANDHFADALIIEGSSGEFQASNHGATIEADEPFHSGAEGGHSLWWRWTSPEDGAFTFLTEGSDFDTVIGVYSGSSLPSLVLEAESDDMHIQTFSSAASWNAVEGATYHVAVDGYGPGDTGMISLSLLPFSDVLDSTGLKWQVSGTYLHWAAQREITFDGEDALMSGFLEDGEFCSVSAVVRGPGTLTFWWMVSSEEDFDELEFYLNNELSGVISGEQDWRQVQAVIPPGEHLVTWRYSKDDSVDGGADAAWLDQVIYTPDGSAPVITSGPSGGVFDPGQTLSLEVVCTGSDLQYEWLLDGTPIAGEAGPVLNLTDLGLGHVGSYTVRVSNLLGFAESAPARLTLRPTQPITLQANSSAESPGGVAFSSSVQPGRDYRVQAADDPRGEWEEIHSFTGTGSSETFTDADAAGGSRRFYRIISP